MVLKSILNWAWNVHTWNVHINSVHTHKLKSWQIFSCKFNELGGFTHKQNISQSRCLECTTALHRVLQNLKSQRRDHTELPTKHCHCCYTKSILRLESTQWRFIKKSRRKCFPDDWTTNLLRINEKVLKFLKYRLQVTQIIHNNELSILTHETQVAI